MFPREETADAAQGLNVSLITSMSWSHPTPLIPALHPENWDHDLSRFEKDQDPISCPLDQLQCFPRGWTNTGMSDGHRAFCMGNALVTGIPHEIGKALVKSLGE